MLKTYTVAFFGHRHIDNFYSVCNLLEEQIINLINKKEFVVFLVGRNGDFDQIVLSTIRKIQKNHRNDNSVLTLLLPYATSEYTENIERFLNLYDEVEISEKAFKSHPKAAIQIRNEEMVEKADLIICYIEHNSGGAYKTIQHAVKQNKSIVNLAKYL